MEGHDEPANRPPVPDELEDHPLGGSHPAHRRPPGRPSVEEVAFGIEAGEVVDIQWRLVVADVGDHDLMVWVATPDHHPAGIQESGETLGGELVGALAGGGHANDRVQQADDAGLGLRFSRPPTAGSPGEAGHQAGAEQQRDRDHLGDRVDPQGVVGRGQEEVVGHRAADRAVISPAARPPTAAATTTTTR
jgi:hypothetical protein